MNYQELATQLQPRLDAAQRIVIIQADNPDGDSLASALALESLLGAAGKHTVLYCAIDMPDHLKHLEGWSRVQKDFPSNYDLAFIVDCGYWRLLGHFEKRYGRAQLDPAKLIVINEHDLKQDMECAINVQDIEAVSSGHIIYELFETMGWKPDKEAASYIASSMLADTLGFTSEIMNGRPRPFEIMARLVEAGVDLSELHEKRLERLRITPELLRYKGELLQRVEYYADNKIALITIPYDEIREHSQEYNPTVILDETRMVDGVGVTIGLKQYVSRGRLVRVTGRIRCNRGYSIANALAEKFEDGGGHVYAAGFKVEGDDLDYEAIKQKVIREATELIAKS